MIQSTTHFKYFSLLSFVSILKEHPYFITNHACSDLEVPSSLVFYQLTPILYDAANRK